MSHPHLCLLSHHPLQVTYDLHQVDEVNLLPLRDTLITALERYHTGPRTVITQLCLAVSGLALQLPHWDNAVQTMIESFGTNPATVPVLLQFLTVLPEELVSNTRIPVTVGQSQRHAHSRLTLKFKDEEYRDRSTKLLTANAPQVLDLLSMYIQASGMCCSRVFHVTSTATPGRRNDNCAKPNIWVSPHLAHRR